MEQDEDEVSLIPTLEVLGNIQIQKKMSDLDLDKYLIWYFIYPALLKLTETKVDNRCWTLLNVADWHIPRYLCECSLL